LAVKKIGKKEHRVEVVKNLRFRLARCAAFNLAIE
jgi:hypothetical protein